MLRRIGLTNFKCFEALDLPCAPLNLLCGLNGMGKSSVIQALLVLRQSFQTGDLLEGRLVLGGTLTDLGAGSDVLFEDADEEVIGFELQRGETPDRWTQAFGYSRTGDQLSVIGPAVEAGVPQLWRAFPPFGGRCHYVQAERVGPRKSYPAVRAGVGPRPGHGRFPRAACRTALLWKRESRLTTWRGRPTAPRSSSATANACRRRATPKYSGGSGSRCYRI